MPLPQASSDFKGKIGPTVAESEPYFEQRRHPGSDSPNVAIVLLDDVGFSQFGCYGSDIDTRHIDRLAANGLKFTNFHVTPLCSPTRASLLTGRSQHAVGMRTISNFTTGFPNQLGHIANNAGTIAEVLRAEGYVTLCTGKWHLAPTSETSAAGPFDQWPLARGFDRFYGFLEGETDQFHPELVVDNHHIDAPKTAQQGYHLSEDLVDQLLRMINDNRSIRPDRPFFAYLPFGATHAPHQAPQAYLDKYRGGYDDGWDVVRQQWYERQIDFGVIPKHTTLAPHNPGVKPWEELTDNEKLLACRLQEAFAAFLDHTDDQIGRFVNGLEAMGELDNTILIVMADNGASQEGGPHGVLHEMKYFNGIVESPDEAVQSVDEIGGPRSHTNYPWGWAQCGNTPFRWYKQNTHEGGVHVPMILHWPRQVSQSDRGTLRHQFINVSDIAPTIYDLLNVTAPDELKGHKQLPITGRSFVTAIESPDAPATNQLQYFENGGSRGLVVEHDGCWWKAVTRHIQGVPFDEDRWELYDLDSDPSECNDLAETEPERLKSLIDLWWSEAERHGVLPLDDRMRQLFRRKPDDHSPHPTNRRYRYRPPMSPIPTAASPLPGGSAWDMQARITRREGEEGAIFAIGNANAGLSVFIQNERLIFDYNAFGAHTIVESATDVPVDESSVSVHLRRTAGTPGGNATVAINGNVCGDAEIPYMMFAISSVGSSVGEDYGLAVSDRYEAPFAFTGTLHEIDIELGSTSDAQVAAHARAELARQ